MKKFIRKIVHACKLAVEAVKGFFARKVTRTKFVLSSATGEGYCRQL